MTGAAGPARGAEVRLEDVSFSYGGPVMHFDLAVAAGSITALMGPSGSGKSTLLSLVAGFEMPRSGRVLIDRLDVTRLAPARRPVSMVFQENNLFAHLDVAANVGLGRSPSLRLGGRDRADIAEALAQVGLADKGARLPRELSGGERQRVALARVLVRNRPVLLLDEAFASLGPALRSDMLDLVLRLHARLGMNVLMVTHDPDDALAIAPDMVFLDGGRVAAAGSTAHLLSPDGPQSVRRYLGTERPPH